MKINNNLEHFITLSTAPLEKFDFYKIFTYDLGLCYTFNSNLAAFISPE